MKLVIYRLASIVNGDSGVIGRLAPKHAEVEGNLNQDKWPRPHQMMVNLVRAPLRNGNLAINRAVQSLVNLDPGEDGRLALNHVDVD